MSERHFHTGGGRGLAAAAEMHDHSIILPHTWHAVHACVTALQLEVPTQTGPTKSIDSI